MYDLCIDFTGHKTSEKAEFRPSKFPTYVTGRTGNTTTTYSKSFDFDRFIQNCV